MRFHKIKSYAKINMALNIVGKKKSLHKIESIISFIYLHDEIFIRKIKSSKHDISFKGKFSKNIGKNNTVFQLLKLLDERKLLKNKKFQIKIIKKIPNKAGLGGGSMNAANILRYFYNNKIIKSNKKKIFEICRLIGSDVILGLNTKSLVLTSNNKIKFFKNCQKMHILITKPNFGCSTSLIYSKVKRFDKPNFNSPTKKMFNYDYLTKMKNSLEPIALTEYSKLKTMKLFIKNFLNPVFVRMTGSGSSLVAYFYSKKRCESAKKKFNKKYRNYWCMASKTI
tara:strand:- start:30 stop:875 length:846 start_codon:yes stop_codon:yes gene_type:complete